MKKESDQTENAVRVLEYGNVWWIFSLYR